MSEIVAGTMVRMRVTRRWSHYNVGDVIAVTLAQGLDLDAKRLARPLDVLVPTPVAAAGSGEVPPTSGPQRQPGQTVRK